MKNFKKVLALLVAVLMIAASVAAFADDTAATPVTGSIDLTGGKAGHTYTLYQIFTGDVNTTTNELTNIQWGNGVTAAYQATFDTAAAAAESYEGQDARDIAQGLVAGGYLTNGAALELTADGNVQFSNLATGYYMITDTNANSNGEEGDYSSALIVKLVGAVTGALKADKPTSEKKVDDKNDSTTDEDTTTWRDSADYDIGDAVPFQLKATTANNVAAYKKYHVTFQDKQSEGLDNPTSFTVTVLGKTFTVPATGDAPAAQTTDNGTQITVERATPETDQTFAIKVTFEPTGEATYLNAECNSTDILVNYTATLNDSAVIGSEGNPNTSYIKYSNNPESSDDHEEGKTPDDTVIVFTYKTVIDKVDEIGEDLKGADFTLYKQVKEGDEGAVLGSALTFAEGVEHSAIKADKYYVVVGHKTGDATGSQFEFKGIDDGIYVLVETTIPTGYNAWTSAEVTVTATHTDGDTPALTELTATAPFTTSNKDAGTVNRTKEGTTHSRVSGEAYAEIINTSGATLPSTGGIGTTIFYVAGGILVLAAVILLVTKRRMNADD